MPDNPKRKSSVTTQEPFAKRLRNNSPIVISDNSDEDIQQISPLRLTAKQKGKGRAVSELRDPPRQLCGGDIITISDDEAPALSRQKTPPEVSYPQSSKSVKGTPLEFEAYTETLSPDQMLAQFRDVSFGERMCSQCRKPIQPPQRPEISTDLRNIAELLHIFCPDCEITHCRGCMSLVQCTSPCDTVDQCDAAKCCAWVRVIAIFEILAILDFSHIKESFDSRKRVGRKTSKRSPTVGPGGTGYATGEPKFGEFDYYDDDIGTQVEYDMDYDGWGNQGWGGFSPEPISWGDDWDSAIDPYKLKKATKSKRSNKTSRRSTRAKGPMTGSDVAVDRTRDLEDVSTWAFHALAIYLPNPYADSPAPFDFVPHPSIGTLLQLSSLPEILGALLRNDSVTDWISRGETYQAMLRLLRRLADCELTITLLVSRGWSKTRSCGIDPLVRSGGEVTWERDEEGGIVRTAPLYNHFEKLTKQSKAYLTGISTITSDIEEAGIREMSLCGDIIAAKEDLDRCLAVMGSGSNSDEIKPDDRTEKTPLSSEGLDKSYERECARLAFEYATLSEDEPTGGLTYRNFQYLNLVEASSNGARIPKDRLHILKELAVMGTALPPGIWVRVDEVRSDVIKIMIAGPENTPYAGGLFEFDCFLPMQYPNTPPLVNLRTTGGGRVRFNPNLYNCGKVCLSLLGTWSGSAEENWQPRKSTLMQVLVSIQSMILIEAPYFNEPGSGRANLKHPASISYNQNIRLQTVRWAIVEWLDNVHVNGMWSDVIRSHFSLKNERIHDCIKAWAKEDPSIENYPSSYDSRTPAYPPRKRRGEVRAGPGGMNLLAEYKNRMQRLLQSTGPALGAVSGSGESKKSV